MHARDGASERGVVALALQLQILEHEKSFVADLTVA